MSIEPSPTVTDVLEETVGHIMIYAAGDRFVMRSLRRVLETVTERLAKGNEREIETISRLRSELDTRERAATP